MRYDSSGAILEYFSVNGGSTLCVFLRAIQFARFLLNLFLSQSLHGQHSDLTGLSAFINFSYPSFIDISSAVVTTSLPML